MKDNKLQILNCGDQIFWCYRHIDQEKSRYTRHSMRYACHDEVTLNNVDILYIHSPDITAKHANYWPLEAHKQGIKVIGQYSGDPKFWGEIPNLYAYADLIVAISPQTYKFCKEHYPNTPVIYLPESVDTNFFRPVDRDNNQFRIGIAGGMHKRVKRVHLILQLNYPITIQDNWKAQRFQEEQHNDLSFMRDFYNSLNCYIITSESECQPRTVLESMASGLPVIATNVGSVPLLLDKAHIVPIYPESVTVAQINEKLALFQGNIQLRNDVGSKNRQIVEEKWSWQNNMPLWDNVIEHVYNNKIDLAVKEADLFIEPFKEYFNA